MEKQDNNVLPDATALPVQSELPHPLITSAGEQVASVADWEADRRPEVQALFAHYMYGAVPAAEQVTFVVDAVDEHYMDDTAIKKQVTINVGSDALSMRLLLVVPKLVTGKVPVFLGPNFHGNHAVVADTDVAILDQWQPARGEGVVDHRATEASRGTSASRWSFRQAVARGYALATFYHGDLDPDHDDFSDGAHAAFPLASGETRDENSWGALSAWAYGIHRAVDYLQTDPDIDPNRIAVMGHSRNGKAALWAGAIDPRIALVVSNQSGCGGAALSRRRVGETVKAINDRFPHWFNVAFRAFNENEDQLPFDQHLLIALMAPRPVLVASAEEDAWADPEGEFLALKAAGPVYSLYGKAGLIEEEMPGNNNLVGAELGYHIRPGGHGVGDDDWRVFMDFADTFFQPVRPQPKEAG
ncbi:MAG: acetylxylan esterase [Bacteroidota bacterium]